MINKVEIHEKLQKDWNPKTLTFALTFYLCDACSSAHKCSRIKNDRTLLFKVQRVSFCTRSEINIIVIWFTFPTPVPYHFTSSSGGVKVYEASKCFLRLAGGLLLKSWITRMSSSKGPLFDDSPLLLKYYLSLLYIDDCRCCVMCANLCIWVKKVHGIVRLSIILSSNNGIRLTKYYM